MPAVRTKEIKSSSTVSLEIFRYKAAIAHADKKFKKTEEKSSSDYKAPIQLRDFLSDELATIKQYLPIISSLRTKGLEKKHFEEMSKAIGIDIDPNKLTVTDLVENKLSEGRAHDCIKGVSEMAFK